MRLLGRLLIALIAAVALWRFVALGWKVIFAGSPAAVP